MPQEITHKQQQNGFLWNLYTTKELMLKKVGKDIKTYIDCEQSLFFLRFSKGSAGACGASTRKTCFAQRTKKKERLLVVY